MVSLDYALGTGSWLMATTRSVLPAMTAGSYAPNQSIDAEAARSQVEVDFVSQPLDQPLHWRRPRKIFVNSMSDLFHEDVPPEYIARVSSALVPLSCGDIGGGLERHC